MSDSEMIQLLSEIRDYMTAGNPVWDTDKVREVMNVAIKAVRKDTEAQEESEIINARRGEE